MKIEILEHLKIRLSEINPDLMKSDEMICGPLITAIAMEVIFNKELDLHSLSQEYFIIKKSKFIKQYNYNSSRIKAKIVNNLIEFETYDSISNSDGNRQALLSDFFCNNEQLGYFPLKNKILTTSEFDSFIGSKFIDFDSFFELSKLTNYMAWINFYKMNKIEVKSSILATRDKLYFLFKDTFIGETYLEYISSFYKDNLNTKEFLPHIFICTKQKGKSNLKLRNFLGTQQVVDCVKANSDYFVFYSNKGIIDSPLEDFIVNNNNHRYEENTHHSYKFIEIIINSSKTTSINLIHSMRLGLKKNASFFEKEDFNKEISIKKIERALVVMEKIKNHARLIERINHIFLYKDFIWIVEYILLLNNLSNKQIGFFEDYDYDDIDDSTAIEYFQRIENDFNQEIKKNEVILTKPLDISQFKAVSLIKELISNVDLSNEGDDLNHCVGGYVNTVKNQTSKIFSIRCNDHKSTLELIRKDDKILIAQHKGLKNSNPYWLNKLVAEHFLSFIQNQISFFKTISKTNLEIFIEDEFINGEENINLDLGVAALTDFVNRIRNR